MNSLLFILKIRENVVIEDDIQLARYELSNLFDGELVSYPNVGEAFRGHGLADLLKTIPALAEPFRGNGVGAFVVTEPRVPLRDLTRRLSYTQEIIVVGQGDAAARTIQAFHTEHPWNSKVTAAGEHVVLRAVPLFCLLECADVVLRYARSEPEIPRLLDALVASLLSERPVGPSVLQEVPTRKTSTYLGHNLHIYKAKFFPRMVRSLINAHLIDLKGKVLLDPFVGSGTALLEAQMMGLSSVGIDLDPLSVAISKAKVELALCDPAQLWDVVDRVSRIVGASTRLQNLGLFEESESVKKTAKFKLPVTIQRKLKEAEAQRIEDDVTLIRSGIRHVTGDKRLKRLLLIGLSDALARKLRLRFLGTGHGRFAVEMRQERLADLFLSHLQHIQKAVNALSYIRERFGLPLEASAQVILGDALKAGLRSQSADLIITSPPYLPAASGRENYVLGKAASLLALNFVKEKDLKRLNDELVGSMNVAYRGDPRVLPKKAVEFVEWLRQDEIRNIKAEPTLRYYLDIRKAFQEFRRVLKPGGACATVVARAHTFYRYRSREIVAIVDNGEIVAEIGRMAGLEYVGAINLKLDKRNAVARPRSRDEYFESIVVFRRSDCPN